MGFFEEFYPRDSGFLKSGDFCPGDWVFLSH